MLESLFNKLFPVNIGKFLRAPILKNICERLLLNDGNSLSWIKSWKPIIAQYDTQPRRIKRLIVLLFLKAPLIVVKKVSTSQNVLTSRNVHGGGGLGHSLIIIKWTWGVFFQKFSIWTPPPPLQSGTKSTDTAYYIKGVFGTLPDICGGTLKCYG